MADESGVVTDNLVRRRLPNRKNTPKVPRKIHKAEREKLKRDHLNELFLELGHALEPGKQCNGKASILGDATRILRELLAQVECLRKENAALVSESHYVAVEKNELKDENIVLGAEIEKLENELQERMSHSEAGWCNGLAHVEVQHSNLTPSCPEKRIHDDATFHPSHAVTPPVFVLPFHPEMGGHQESNIAQVPQCEPSNSHVRRPQARYPTPSDAWPSHLLAPREAQEEAPPPNSGTSTRGSN